MLPSGSVYSHPVHLLICVPCFMVEAKWDEQHSLMSSQILFRCYDAILLASMMMMYLEDVSVEIKYCLYVHACKAESCFVYLEYSLIGVSRKTCTS